MYVCMLRCADVSVTSTLAYIPTGNGRSKIELLRLHVTSYIRLRMQSVHKIVGYECLGSVVVGIVRNVYKHYSYKICTCSQFRNVLNITTSTFLLK